MKTWMIEGMWKLPATESLPRTVVLRSLVRAKTKKEAEKVANAAIKQVAAFLQDLEEPEGNQEGPAQVIPWAEGMARFRGGIPVVD